MTENLAIRHVVCRGMNELNPKVWEVWGTSRNCSSIDVRFLLSGTAGKPEAVPSKIVTVIPRRNAEPRWDIQCAEDEDLWVARFFHQEHPELRLLRKTLKEAPDRVVEIEAKATVDPSAQASSAVTQTFRDADIILGYEFEAGVLLVHGIGPHQQGNTLIRFAEPLVDFLQRWLRGVSDQWSKAYTKKEAEQWRDRIFASTLRHQQNLFDLSDEVHRFVKEAAVPAPAIDKANLEKQMSKEFLVGDVCVIDTVLRVLASEPEVTGSALLRLSTLDRSGALEQTHVLVTEAWWTDEVASPTITQLRHWIFSALPQVVSTYVAAPTQATKRRVAAAGAQPAWRGWLALSLDYTAASLLRAPLALLFCVGIQLTLSFLAIVSLLPIAWVKAMSNALIRLLMGTTGQSYAMVTSELRRSAIVCKVGRRLDWLCERCEKVIVLAHSQGAEVSRYVIGTRKRDQLQRWISFGSGIKMLAALTTQQTSRHRYCAAYAFFTLLLIGGAAVFGIPAGSLLPTVYAALVMIGSYFLEPPPYCPTFRASVPWTDYYASRDPVSCGPLSDEKDMLNKIGFKLIEVHNKASTLLDHTSYFENTEEFVAPVAFDIAQLAGIPLANLMVGDEQRLKNAKARRREIVLRKHLIGRLTALALVPAALLSIAANSVAWSEWIETVFAAWPTISWSAWFSTIVRAPAVMYAAIPVLIVLAIYVLERVLLRYQLALTARSLVSRREPSTSWTTVVLRLLAYAVGSIALVWWGYRENLGAVLMALFTG